MESLIRPVLMILMISFLRMDTGSTHVEWVREYHKLVHGVIIFGILFLQDEALYTLYFVLVFLKVLSLVGPGILGMISERGSEIVSCVSGWVKEIKVCLTGRIPHDPYIVREVREYQGPVMSDGTSMRWYQIKDVRTGLSITQYEPYSFRYLPDLRGSTTQPQTPGTLEERL